MRAALLSLLLASAASAGLWGRSRVTSAWTAEPVSAETETQEWPSDSCWEESGMSFRAFNDASALTLLVSASSREGRSRLNGDARQDVELWFRRSGARDWGLRLPYSRAERVEPELLTAKGPVVSSSSWPTELGFRLLHRGRRPVWEILVPTAKLAPDKEGQAEFDLAYVGTGRTQEEIVRAREQGPDDEGPSRGRDRRRRSSELDDPVREMGPSTLKLRLELSPPPDAAH